MPRNGCEHFGARIDLFTEARLTVVERRPMLTYCAPCPGNMKPTLRSLVSLDDSCDALRVARVRGARPPPRGCGDQRKTMAECAATDLEACGRCLRARCPVLFEVGFQLAGGAVEASASRAESTSSCSGARPPRGCARGRLLEDDMRVGAADSERAHAGAARRRHRPATAQCRVDEERRVREVELGIRRSVVQARRQGLVVRARARS